MQLQFWHTIDVPPERAWSIFHGRIEHMAPELPDVHQVRILEHREPEMTRLEQDLAWAIDQRVIPHSARPFIGDQLRELLSTLYWDHKNRRVDFRFYHLRLPGLFDCQGQADLSWAAEGTHIRISADLAIKPHLLPGVPRWLGRSVEPAVRRVVERTLGRILDALPGAVARISHDDAASWAG